MANRISGPGLGLPYPQLNYPSNIFNGEFNVSTNDIALAPGESVVLPAGELFVTTGKYSSLQYLDPVTNIWTMIRSGNNVSSHHYIRSDGFNIRVANLTGCAVGASVTASSAGYSQATTTVSPSTGNSTWLPIVGGAINATISITAVGAGYGMAPIVFFDAPPSPGVQATGIAAISGGTVTSITVTNQGAGYPTAPNVNLVPNAFDPNLLSGAITAQATAVCSLTAAGSITAVLCTNPGAPVASTMSLTVVGAGTGATVAALFLNSITGASIISGGGGYGTFTALTTLNGGFAAAAPALTNPEISLQGFVPRPATIPLTLTGTALTTFTAIQDGGLFLSTPGPLPLTNGIVTTVASIALTLGGQNDSFRVQSL